MNGRQRKVAGWAGILFVMLFVAGIGLSSVGNSPSLDASAAKITQYYQSHHAGILVGELLISLAAVALLWFVGGLFAIIRQRDEHGFLAPVVLASGAVTVVLGIVSDIAGTVAALLAAQHRLADPSLTRALLELSTGVHMAFFPLVALTAALAAAIFQGAIGARWVGWVSVLSSAACLVSVVLGNLETNTMLPPAGLLGFFIAVVALSVSMLRYRSPAPAAGPAACRQRPRTSSRTPDAASAGTDPPANPRMTHHGHQHSHTSTAHPINPAPSLHLMSDSGS